MQITSSENISKAYHARDKNALERLLSDDFAFCSPLDTTSGKDHYLKTCSPSSEHQLNHLIERLSVEGNEAFVTCECERTDGTKFRNTEFFRIEGDKITHVDVYFGLGTAPTSDKAEKRGIDREDRFPAEKGSSRKSCHRGILSRRRRRGRKGTRASLPALVNPY